MGGWPADGKRFGVMGVALLGMLWLSNGTAVGQDTSTTVTVTVNQSRVMSLGTRVKTVSVAQPDIADVVVLDPNQLLINGKSVGKTSLVIWNERGTITNLDLIVLPDTGGLRRQLGALFPEERIEVLSSGPAVVLKGEVSNEVVYDKVLDVVRTYLPPAPAAAAAPAPTNQSVNISVPRVRLPQTGTAFAGGGQLAFEEEQSLTDPDRWPEKRRIPGLIDLLVIRESRQIQVNVIVAEISLTKLRELGVDFGIIGKNTAFLSRSGTQGGFPAGPLFEDPSTFPPTVTFGGGASAVLSYITNGIQIGTVFRLLQDREVSEILAQPKLVMKNGRSGGFLAGGEIPIPFATQDDITIEFRPFGVRLDFVPTLTWSDTIDLRIFPEVSEIDSSVSVTFAGVTVPGLRIRRSVNRVEMKEGETLILSGLLDRRILKDVSKFPFLGDLPILGAIFRTTRFRDQETELIFVVTPQVVKALRPGVQPPLPSSQKYDDPDTRQVPLPSTPPAPSSVAPGEPQARGTWAPVPDATPSVSVPVAPRSTLSPPTTPDVRYVPPPRAESLEGGRPVHEETTIP